MGLIFAEVQDHWVAVLVVVGPIFGGGAMWCVGQLWKWMDRRQVLRKELRSERKEDEQTIVDHYKELDARKERRLADLEEEMATVRNNVVLLIRHVSYLEGVMESRKIQFRPFDMSVLTPATRNQLSVGEGTQDD